MSTTHEGKVAYACVHQELRLRGKSMGYYVLVLQDESVFFSKRPVKLVDGSNKLIPAAVEITPDSEVRVRYGVDRGIRRMTAVQIVRLHDGDQGAFEPVEGEGVYSHPG